MKNIIILILTTATALVLSSCSKNDTLSTHENEINCASNFSNHVNANAFQSIVDKYATNGFVGMTVLVDHPEDGIWIGSSGYASIEKDIEMNPCHLQHTASLYKTFIATVIMQLVEEGTLNLNDRLSDFISTDIIERLPNGNSITIKHLLQQRTGLPDIFEVDFITDFFNNPTASYTIKALLAYIYDKDPLSEVDTKFHYSDANFSLLTLVIEELEGDYVKSLKDRILMPLNLNDTYFLEDANQLPTGLVDSYWDRYGDGNIENNSEIQIALTTGLKGSDGIVSTANDLMVFIQALAKGTLVDNVSEMTAFLNVPEEVQEREVYSGYGMGLMKVNISGVEWYGHFGNHIGSGAFMLYNAQSEITIVALQNTGTFFSDEIKGKFFYQLIDDIEGIVL